MCFHLDKLQGWCGNLLVFCSFRFPFISLVCVPPGIRKYNFGDAAALVWKKGNQLYHGAKREMRVWDLEFHLPGHHAAAFPNGNILGFGWNILVFEFQPKHWIFSFEKLRWKLFCIFLEVLPRKNKTLSNQLYWRSHKSDSPFFDHLSSC